MVQSSLAVLIQQRYNPFFTPATQRQDIIYTGGPIMSKPRDTQKSVKKKAEKTLKEKRNEKKEKKKQKG
jgi:hypothetical protein